MHIRIGYYMERCDCSINEILGYINSFVEHEKMKVIIVANQEEIGKSVTEKGREFRACGQAIW